MALLSVIQLYKVIYKYLHVTGKMEKQQVPLHNSITALLLHITLHSLSQNHIWVIQSKGCEGATVKGVMSRESLSFGAENEKKSGGAGLACPSYLPERRGN